MSPVLLACLFAAVLSGAGGWIVVRAELRSVGELGVGRVPMIPGTQPKLGVRIILSTLQVMLALWTIGLVVGFWILGLPEAAGGPESAGGAVDIVRRATVAGCLGFLPLSIGTLIFAARSLRQHSDDGKGVAPLIAAATFLIALFAIYARPTFWSG